MQRSKRFDLLAQRDINKETYVEPWPEAGLIVADSPYDPAPSLKIEDGRVLELDGVARADFDALDIFIATRALDLESLKRRWRCRQKITRACWPTSTCRARRSPA